MIVTEKRRVRVPSGELAVVEAGDPEAPPVVLLSGGFTSSYLWRHLVPLLAPWMRVLAPDLLGSGDSDSPEGADLRLPAHAANVRALLGALGIERFAVAGHGRGAGIAQLLAVEGGVEALCSSTRSRSTWPRRGSRSSIASGEVDDAFIRSWLEGSSSGDGTPRTPVEPTSRIGARSRADGAERFVRIAGALDGVGLVDLEPRLAEPDRVRAVGRTTRSCRPSSPNAWATLPWAAVALLPRCGHFLLETPRDRRPGWCVAADPVPAGPAGAQHERAPSPWSSAGARRRRTDGDVAAVPDRDRPRPVVTARTSGKDQAGTCRRPGRRGRGRGRRALVDLGLPDADPHRRETVERDSFDLLESLAHAIANDVLALEGVVKVSAVTQAAAARSNQVQGVAAAATVER
jgi:pimeloyl-ACP methyl ester carboxylesterase